MRKAKSAYPVDVDGMTFRVWYQVCPAEPDVGIMYPYVEMEVEDGPLGIDITEDLEDSIRAQLESELSL